MQQLLLSFFFYSRGLCFDMAAGFETSVCYVSLKHGFALVTTLFLHVTGKLRHVLMSLTSLPCYYSVIPVKKNFLHLVESAAC